MIKNLEDFYGVNLLTCRRCYPHRNSKISGKSGHHYWVVDDKGVKTIHQLAIPERVVISAYCHLNTTIDAYNSVKADQLKELAKKLTKEIDNEP